MVMQWNIMIGLVYQWCNDQIFNPRVCSLVNLKFIDSALDILQHYHLKYYKKSVAITEDNRKILNWCTTHDFYLKEHRNLLGT